MSGTTELILGIAAFIVIIALTRKYHAWRFKRAYIFIIDDLKNKGAYSAHAAVELPYTKRNMLRMGMRQHHPQALEKSDAGKTGAGQHAATGLDVSGFIHRRGQPGIDQA